jgi:hypothetical protein
MFLQLPFQKGERELGRVDGELELAEQIGQRSHVVLVAVGEDDGLQAVRALPQVLEVGKDEIDARHLHLGEGQPRVDHQDAALDLQSGHVASDLSEAAQEHQARITGARGGGELRHP